MKAKYFMYLGLCLIFVSLVMMATNIDKVMDSIGDKMQYESKELEVDPTSIKNVVLDTFNSSVIVLPTDEDKITISYYENKYIKYEDFIEGDTFSFIGEKNSKFPFDWFFFWGNKTTTIKVPNNLVLDFNIKTSNGKMEANDMKFSGLEFRTSNGSILLNNIESSNNIVLHTSNGGITFDSVIASKLIDMRTSNGSLNLDDVKANEINGNTSNGRISFKGLTCDDITLRTSNGRVEGIVVGINNDYAKYMRTSNGNVTIDGSKVDKFYQADRDKDKKVDLSTSNGSIELEFK